MCALVHGCRSTALLRSSSGWPETRGWNQLSDLEVLGALATRHKAPLVKKGCGVPVFTRRRAADLRSAVKLQAGESSNMSATCCRAQAHHPDPCRTGRVFARHPSATHISDEPRASCESEGPGSKTGEPDGSVLSTAHGVPDCRDAPQRFRDSHTA